MIALPNVSTFSAGACYIAVVIEISPIPRSPSVDSFPFASDPFEEVGRSVVIKNVEFLMMFVVVRLLLWQITVPAHLRERYLQGLRILLTFSSVQQES